MKFPTAKNLRGVAEPKPLSLLSERADCKDFQCCDWGVSPNHIAVGINQLQVRTIGTNLSDTDWKRASRLADTIAFVDL